MATEKKTHWKKLFNYEYLGAYSLADSLDETKAKYIPQIVTIDLIKKQDVRNERGVENLPICYFKEKVGGEKKGMVLNKTNCRVMETLTGSFYYEDWLGKQIELYVDPKIKAQGGELVDGLRLRKPTKLIQKPELTPKHPKWNNAKKAVLNGDSTIVSIRKNWTITQENFDLLSKPE